MFTSCRIGFLRTTPPKNPRTECDCQPVLCMMLAMVAPLGRLSRVSTVVLVDSFFRFVDCRYGTRAFGSAALLLQNGTGWPVLIGLVSIGECSLRTVKTTGNFAKNSLLAAILVSDS